MDLTGPSKSEKFVTHPTRRANEFDGVKQSLTAPALSQYHSAARFAVFHVDNCQETCLLYMTNRWLSPTYAFDVDYSPVHSAGLTGFP